MAAASIAYGYYSTDKQYKEDAAAADRQIKMDFLEGVASQGDEAAFQNYLRQNEMSAGSMNAAQLVNEYAVFNGQKPDPAMAIGGSGNQGDNGSNGSGYSVENVDYQMDQLKKDWD